MSTVIAYQNPIAGLPLVRTYLSTSYLTSAALLAKKAYEVESSEMVREGRIGLVQLGDHHAFASSAIVMSVFGVEAFVNELFADCQSTGAQNLFGLSAAQARKLGRVWNAKPPARRDGRRPQRDLQSRRTLDKYSKVLTELGISALDFSSEPVKAMETLISLRNALAHYKMTVRKAGSDGEQRWLTRLEKKLQQYFHDYDKPAHNPMTGVNNAYIPDRVIGHAVAEWSVQTAVAFLEHFREKLSVTPQTGHRWPINVMLQTR